MRFSVRKCREVPVNIRKYDNREEAIEVAKNRAIANDACYNVYAHYDGSEFKDGVLDCYVTCIGEVVY